MQTLSIGIDPGLSGAIAKVTSDTGLYEVYSMPLIKRYGTSEVDYDRVLSDLKACNMVRSVQHNVKVWIEELTQIPKSWQKLKTDYNKLCNILSIVFEPNQINQVHCKSWRKYAEYTCHRPTGTTKQRSVKCAEHIFNTAELDLMRKKRGSIDHNKADAALIAYYGLNK